LFITPQAFAQPGPVSVELFGAYTTSSKLFPYPNDPSDVRRAFYLSLTDIFHFGIDFRTYVHALDVQIGVGTEVIQKTETSQASVGSASVPVRDGFRVFPVELTGYFTLPIGNDKIRIYLGGGVGFYSGERIYQYASVSSAVTERTAGFGIHVLCGGEYRLSGRWSLRSELKVRDVQFQSVNQFTGSTVIYEGTVVPLPQEPFASKFSIDGLTVLTGVAWYF
jgi:opacity protein-like surface antigen